MQNGYLKPRPNMWYPKNVCFAAKVLHLFYLWRTRGSLPSDLVVPYFRQHIYIYIYMIYQTLFHGAMIHNWDIVYIGYTSIQFTNSNCFFGVELNQKWWILNCIGSSCSWGKPTSLRTGVFFENRDVWVDMRYSLISWSRVGIFITQEGDWS